MPRQPQTNRSEDDIAARVGGTAVGLLAGLFIGSVAAAVFGAAGFQALAGWAFFVPIAGGAVAGYVSAAAGMSLAEGVVHFAVGVAHGIAEQFPSPSARVPLWLRWLFVAGVISGLALLITVRW